MLRDEFLINTVLEAHKTLIKETDLSPANEHINKALSSLVEMVTRTYTIGEEKKVLADPRVQEIRGELLDRLSAAEGAMEKYWADHFLAQPELTVKDLEDFWYWQNYIDLTNLEIDEFPQSPNRAPKAAFIGAGALPLTAIIYHLQTGNPITCVDSDPVACDKAERLLEKLGLNDMDVVCTEGSGLDFDDYGTVFIASLVSNPHKDGIVDAIKQSQSETLIAVRSAERLHTILYEEYAESNPTMDNCYFVGKTRHNPSVINTTLIFHSEAAKCGACEKRQQGHCAPSLRFGS